VSEVGEGDDSRARWRACVWVVTGSGSALHGDDTELRRTWFPVPVPNLGHLEKSVQKKRRILCLMQ